MNSAMLILPPFLVNVLMPVISMVIALMEDVSAFWGLRVMIVASVSFQSFRKIAYSSQCLTFYFFIFGKLEHSVSNIFFFSTWHAVSVSKSFSLLIKIRSAALSIKG